MWWKVCIAIIAVGNVAFGLVSLAAPAPVAAWIGFELADAQATGEMRAVYGGLVLGLGVVMGWALRRSDGAHWFRAMGLCFFGLVLGRLVSLVLDGATLWNAAAGLLELAAGGLLLFAASRSDTRDAA